MIYKDMRHRRRYFWISTRTEYDAPVYYLFRGFLTSENLVVKRDRSGMNRSESRIR